MPTVRIGLLTLPLAGLLAIWATVAASTFVDAGIEPLEAASAYNATSYFLSQFVGHIFALTVYLSDIRGERWTLGAMVLSILGIGLLLSVYGLRTYALPALGGAYLSGQQNAIEMANVVFGYPLTLVFYVAFLLYSAGFILFGFAIWGSGTLPEWAGVLLAIHAPLLSGPLPEAFAVLGALLLLIGGGWLAFAVLRKSPARVGDCVEAESKPRERTRARSRIRRTGAK